MAKLFAKDGYQRKIYTYSVAVANFSFMGNAVVLGVFGEEILFDYMIFTMPLNLYVYSIGTASLIPNEKGGKFSIKAFVNPIFIIYSRVSFLHFCSKLTKKLLFI